MHAILLITIAIGLFGGRLQNAGVNIFGVIHWQFRVPDRLGKWIKVVANAWIMPIPYANESLQADVEWSP